MYRYGISCNKTYQIVRKSKNAGLLPSAMICISTVYRSMLIVCENDLLIEGIIINDPFCIGKYQLNCCAYMHSHPYM
jgi:hypothetical protein